MDVLGPPPASIMKYEMDTWRHLVDPVYAAKLKRDKEAEAEAKAREEKRQQEAAAAAAASAANGGSDSVAGTPRGAAGAAGRIGGAGGKPGSVGGKGGTNSIGHHSDKVEKLSLEESTASNPNPLADSNKVRSLFGMMMNGEFTRNHPSSPVLFSCSQSSLIPILAPSSASTRAALSGTAQSQWPPHLLPLAACTRCASGMTSCMRSVGDVQPRD